MIGRFPKCLQQTKMAVCREPNPIIQQISLIIVRAKGGFILFDGVELMSNRVEDGSFRGCLQMGGKERGRQKGPPP